jgi:hypothetical protein
MFVVLAVMALWSELTDNTAALNAMHANPAVDYWDVDREVSCHGGERGLPGACLARVYDKCLPTFVIAGAMKAGTGALMKWLNTHPALQSGVALTGKREVHFFDMPQAKWDATWRHCPLQTYAQSFAPDQITFDKTPSYMRTPEAMARLMRMMPGTRVVVLLRDPVSRAYSGFMHHCRKERYSRISPTQVVLTTDISQHDTNNTSTPLGKHCTKEDFHDYYGTILQHGRPSSSDQEELDIGDYAPQLRNMFTAGLRASHILVLFQETMRQDTHGALEAIQRFAGIPPGFIYPPPDVNGHPMGGYWPHTSSTIARGWGVIFDFLGVNPHYRAPMLEETRRALQDYYTPSIRSLAALLESDFGLELPTSWPMYYLPTSAAADEL